MKRILLSVFLIALPVLFSSCSFFRLVSPPASADKSIGILGVSASIRTGNGGENFSMQMVDDIIALCDTAKGYPLARLMSIPSDSISHLEKVGGFRTYVPPHPGLEGAGFKPDVILLIKSLSIRNKEVEHSGMAMTVNGMWIGTGKGSTTVNQMLSISYVFWDNRDGRIIGYGKVKREIMGGESGPSETKRKKTARHFANKMVAALTKIAKLK